MVWIQHYPGYEKQDGTLVVQSYKLSFCHLTTSLLFIHFTLECVASDFYSLTSFKFLYFYNQVPSNLYRNNLEFSHSLPNTILLSSNKSNSSIYNSDCVFNFLSI